MGTHPIFESDFDCLTEKMSFLFAIGLFFIIYVTCHGINQFLWMQKLRNGDESWPQRLKAYGGWAVVTGCTDGIGKQYCLEMAACTNKFVLIGRNMKKLSLLTQEMSERNPDAEFITLTVDFADTVDYEQLEKQLKNLDIGVFMNFVGVSYPLPQKLHDLDKMYENLSWEHINVNLMSATNLSRIIIPGMVKRQRGLVVYVSSGSSTQPTPMQSSYAAGKKLLDKLALDMNIEYKEHNIDFQSIKPYYVATKMTANKLRHNYQYSTMIPSAEEYTRQALGTIGKFVSTHAYAPHCVQSWMRNFS